MPQLANTPAAPPEWLIAPTTPSGQTGAPSGPRPTALSCPVSAASARPAAMRPA